MSQAEKWQLGGNAPEVYETQLVPAIFGPWAPLLVEQAALHAGERVLDARQSASAASMPAYARGNCRSPT